VDAASIAGESSGFGGKGRWIPWEASPAKKKAP
jgi:hypothetical protein